MTYYFIQYLDSAGLAKRGWVDSSLGTVSYNVVNNPAAYDVTNEFIIRNRSTDRVLAWNPSTNAIEQQVMVGGPYQLFKFEKSRYNGAFTGYFHIVAAENPNLVMQIPGTAFANGLSPYMEIKSTTDKRQEFRLELGDYSATENATYVNISARCTGEYRFLEANGTLNAIQTTKNGLPSQDWEIILVGEPWDRGYENTVSSGHPGDFQIKVDDSVLNHLTLSDIQNCINRWNYADSNFSIQAVRGSGFSSKTLAILSAVDFDLYGEDFNTTTGITCPVLTRREDYLSPNMNPSLLELNASWYTTHVLIDFDHLEEYYSTLSEAVQQTTSFADICMSTITHELGHSLKMTHIFFYYNEPMGTWNAKNYSRSIMSPNKDEYYNNGYLQSIDFRRFEQKWSTD